MGRGPPALLPLGLLALLLGLLAPAPAGAALGFLQHGYHATLVTDELPAGARNVTVAADGYLYAIVDQGTGDVGPEDNSLYRIDGATGAVTHQGKIALTAPATSNLYRVAPGPGGNLTDKLYVVDWISGAPARIDRFEPDLSGHETIFAFASGDPGTLTSNIAFSTSLEYLEAGYFAGQASGIGGSVWRFGIVPDTLPFPWADPPGSADVRAVAFAPGGAFGSEMYVAQSTVLNGFDDAPGEIRRLFSDGVGNYLTSTVLVSEASGLLEFGVELVFDTGGLFDGDLLYLQADGLLLRVTPAGAVSAFITGVRNMAIHPATGELLVLTAETGRTELYRVGLPTWPPVPALAPPSLLVVLGLLLLSGAALAAGRR